MREAPQLLVIDRVNVRTAMQLKSFKAHVGLGVKTDGNCLIRPHSSLSFNGIVRLPVIAAFMGGNNLISEEKMCSGF